ncbi:anthrone oxygenase family protein [Marisediminicola sp. LYQ85]|uniref:anthrone oxygenase family protein n=1 Tax=Marisediminicola sp. LYQ85 TaxID=3391062 RepID=UPI0039835351
MIHVAAVVGAGLLSGVYAAFSTIVVPALRCLDDRAATAAMIEINRRAERGPFIVLFGSAAVAAVALGIGAIPRGAVPELVIAGASLASTVVTMTVNVPLNRRLHKDGAGFWSEYSRRWAAANTARAAFAATALIVAGTHWSLK